MLNRNEKPELKRVSFRTLRSPLPNTSGRVFEHMHTASLQHCPALNAAHSLWVNSMCIRTETLDRSGLGSEAVNAETPLDVLLVLHVNDIPTVDSTAYSLTMKISPTCTKSFQLTAVTSVRFARCCSSRFAIASSAAPSVVGGGAEGGVGDDGGAQDAAWRCVS